MKKVSNRRNAPAVNEICMNRIKAVDERNFHYLLVTKIACREAKNSPLDVIYLKENGL